MTAPRFLADEDLRGSIVAAVRRLDPAIELTRVVDAGLGGKSDDEILQYAAANSCILVSHDVNTMRAAAERRVAEGAGLSGLLLVHQDVETRTVADDLVLIWSASQADEWRDRVVFLPL